MALLFELLGGGAVGMGTLWIGLLLWFKSKNAREEREFQARLNALDALVDQMFNR